MEGVVKWFDNKKGYGFASSEGKDFFLHFREIIAEGYKSLAEGDKIRFEASESGKGPVARQITKIVP